MNANGTNPRQLLEEGHTWGAVWSLDGTRIAFSSAHDGDVEIFVVNADGSGQHQLTYNTYFTDSHPVWIPA